MNLFEVMAKISLDSSGYEKGLAKAKKSSNEYKKDVMNLAQAYKKQGMNMSDAMKRAYSEIDKSQYDMSNNSKKTKNQMGLDWQNLGSKVKGVADKIGAAVNVGMKAAGTAVIAFGASSIKTGMEFDAAMSQVASTMGMSTDDIKNNVNGAGDTFKQLRQFAQQMGESTKFSATEAADALNYMALAGYDSEKSMKMLPNVLNLAAAGNIDLASASDMVTDAQSALGLNMKQTNKMVDQMAAASSKSNTSVSQLGDAMLTVGATARSIRGGTREISTILGVLADNNMKGAEGGTHLRNMLVSLQTPTKSGTEALKKLNMTYDDMYDSSGKLRSLPEIFVEMQGKMEGMTQRSKDAIVSGLFNKYDLSAANALLGTSKDRFDELSESIKESKGAAEDMANTQLDNLSGDVTKMKSAFEGLQIAVSDKASPALRKFTQAATTGLGDITKAIKPGNLSKAFDVIVESLSKAVSKVEKVGGELLDKVVSGIKNNATKIGPAAMDVVVNFSAKLREKASGLVDAGLKLIMSLADGLIKNIPTLIKTVPTIISNLAGVINDNAPKLIAAGAILIVKLAKGIIISIPTLVKEFPKIIKAVVDVWSAFQWLNLGKIAITAIKNGVTNAGPKIVSGLKDIGSKAINAFKSVNWAGVGRAAITTIRNAVSNAADMILSALRTIGNNGIKSFKAVNWAAVGKAVINLIANAIRGAANLVITGLRTVATSAMNAFKSLDWMSIGTNVIRGIAAGITGGISSIANAAKNAAQSALNAAKDFLGIHSPSKVAEKQIGLPYVQGIAQGIEKNKKYAESSAQEIGEAIIIASEKNLSNFKVYKEVTLEQEKDYWDAVRKQVKKGTQARIDADEKYFEAKKAYVQQVKEQEKEAAQSTLNQWTEAVTLLRGTNGKIEESGSKLYASLTQNVAKIKSLAKKAGVDYNSVLLEAADKRLSNAKSMMEVDLEEEMIYWGKVSKAIKKGTQARIDADAKYKDAMKAYRESIQKVADEADTMAESFTKSIDEINKALDNSRKDAWDKYSSAIASRESSLVSTVKLFDQFKATDLPTYSGVIGYDDEGKEILGEWEATTDDIINNLHKQLVAVDEWDKTLDSLEQRVGNNEVLVDAFRNMGFDSYQTLKKINDMTDEQLKTYVAEFEMIQDKMHNRAKSENEDLRKQTEENIATMEADAKEQIATLEKSYNEKISELAKTLKESSSKVGNNIIKGTSNGIKDKLEDIKTAALKIASKVESTKSQAKSSGKNIGSKISEGIEQGIRSGQSGIASTARSAALAAYNAAKQALNIHSPSRKFAWIGQMVDEGFAQGIDKNADSVENAISSLGNITPFPSPSDWSTATATVPSGSAGNNTTTITMNIYGAQGQDVKALADEVERRLNAKVVRGGIAFA